MVSYRVDSRSVTITKSTEGETAKRQLTPERVETFRNHFVSDRLESGSVCLDCVVRLGVVSRRLLQSQPP